MFFKAKYNFIKEISNVISELRSLNGDLVDTSKGLMKIEEVIKIALDAGKNKEFVNDGNVPSLTPETPTLFHYTSRKQLVWSVYFSQYFTEEERNNEYKDLDYVKSITYAVVKIDDATGEVIFADFIRPHFNQYYGEVR